MKRSPWPRAASKRVWDDAREKVDAEGQCRVCRSQNGLQAAHLVPRSQVAPGPGEDPRNIIPLCVACHRAHHDCRLELLKYLEYDEQGYVSSLVGIARAYRMLTLRRAA